MPTFREKIIYGNAYAATIKLANLASDTNLLVGVESDAIDNTTEGLIDIIVSGRFTTGTSPAASKSIELWAVGSRDGTNWSSVFDGTASDETIPNSGTKQGLCKFLHNVSPSNSSDTSYHFSGISLANAFGGFLPPKVVFFVTHSTGVNLNSDSAQHLIYCQPVYRQIATV